MTESAGAMLSMLSEKFATRIDPRNFEAVKIDATGG